MVTINLEQVMEAITDRDYAGFCLACGQEAFGCEPDARNYTCEFCEADQVFGAEEILIMGATH